jgi:hypothetical protein
VQIVVKADAEKLKLVSPFLKKFIEEQQNGNESVDINDLHCSNLNFQLIAG